MVVEQEACMESVAPGLEQQRPADSPYEVSEVHTDPLGFISMSHHILLDPILRFLCKSVCLSWSVRLDCLS